MILPSQDRTRALLVLLLTLCRDMGQGLLPTAAAQGQEPSVLTAQKKRLHILYVIGDVAATLSLSQIDRYFKPLPNVDLKAAREELKIHIVVLSQLAACGAEGPSALIKTSVLPACVKRGLLTQQESTHLQAQVEARTGQDGAEVTEQLQLEYNIEIEEESVLDQEIVVDRILPSHHGVTDDPAAPWDVLPPANGLYLKQTRGFPLRAGALQGGIFLQNGGPYTWQTNRSYSQSLMPQQANSQAHTYSQPLREPTRMP